MDEPKHFVALRDEALNKNEKAGLEKFFSMLLAIRQQIWLRNKSKNN